MVGNNRWTLQSQVWYIGRALGYRWRSDIRPPDFANISHIEGLDDPIPESTVYESNIPILSEIILTPDEVEKAMRNLKPDSAPGPD